MAWLRWEAALDLPLTLAEEVRCLSGTLNDAEGPIHLVGHSYGGVSIAAASLRVPTLLFSGGLSPYFTQRIVQRLGAIIDGAEILHLPAAGHMLPLTHASSVNPVIARHIARADELAGVPLALEAAPAEAVSLAEG